MKKHINIIGNILLLMMFLLLSMTAKAQPFTSCVGGNPIYLPDPNVPSPYTLMWAQYSYAGSELYVVNNKVTIEKYFVGTIYVECYYKCVRQYTVAGHVYEDHQTNTTYFGIKCDPVYTTGLPNQLTMQVGETKTVDWSYSPSYVSRPNLTWTSSDYSVVDVNSNKLTAKKSGRAVVTVKSNAGPDEYINVTVEGGSDVIYVNSISLNETSVSLTEGSTKQLQATVLPSNATDKSVSWSSSNNSVAQVSSSGLVTAESIGTATITCKANDGSGASATCSITVNSSTIEPTSISLPASKTVKVGESFTMTYTLTPSNATTTLTWSSDDTNIATVSSSGVVKGIKAGTTKIRVKTANGKTDYCNVTVESNSKPKLMLTASPSGGLVSAGTTVTLTAITKVSVWENDGSHGEINWGGEYRFCLEGTDTHNECIAEFPQEIWNRIKSEKFYVTIRGDYPQIYVASGWWSHKWTGEDIVPGNELLTDNGDGTWTLTVNLAGDPLLDVLDERHLLFTGEGYSVEEIYFGNSISNCDIYYTLNDTTPTKSSTKYTSGGIIINGNCTLKAIAYKEGYATSDVLTEEFRIEETIASKNIVSISAGEYASSFITDDGELWTSGYTPNCPSYDYDHKFIDSRVPIKTMENVKFCIATNFRSLILLNDNSLWFCGFPLVPVKLYLVTENVVSIALGEHHGLYVKSDGTMYAFGYNDHGQYGCGTTEEKQFPEAAIKVMDGVESVAAGGDNSYILKKDGTLWACGDNGSGQIGDGTTIERLSPVYIMNNVKKIAAGWYHTLILKNDGTLWGCGSNGYYGQLGNGTGKDEYSPIILADNVSDISANIHSSFMIKKDGSLWACGDNEFGQLGDGTTVTRKVFTRIMDGVSKVSAGHFYTIILKKDGIVWTCGRNQYGQLGDGTMTDKITPVRINKKTNANEELIKISETGYATYFDSQSSYMLPNGLSAQVVTNASNNKLTYKIIADGSVSGVIPKGTAVMLVTDNKQAGTFTLTSSESAVTYTGTNLLHGSDEATTTTGNGYHYKLSYGPTGTKWDNVFGWYWGANDGAPFQIEEHKAWLVVPRGNGTRAAGFTIAGDVLGIESLEDLSDTPSDLYFDLQGRRLSQPTKRGVYIKNGMKVIFK